MKNERCILTYINEGRHTKKNCVCVYLHLYKVVSLCWFSAITYDYIWFHGCKFHSCIYGTMCNLNIIFSFNKEEGLVLQNIIEEIVFISINRNIQFGVVFSPYEWQNQLILKIFHSAQNNVLWCFIVFHLDALIPCFTSFSLYCYDSVIISKC